MSNRSPLAPALLRFLVIGWSKAAFKNLELTLAPLRKARQVSLDEDEFVNTGKIQHSPGYFHILAVPSTVLVAVSGSQRQKLSRLANLLILLPGGGNQARELLGESLAGIAFPDTIEEPAAIAFIQELCTALVSQQQIYAAVNQAWQTTLPNSQPPWLALLDGSEAIWPPALAIPQTPSQTATPAVPVASTPNLGPAVVIGQAIINPVNASFGDQVNITRDANTPAQHHNIAGGDQINIISDKSRIPAPPQRNIQSDTGPFCTACGKKIEPGAKSCAACGAKQVKD